MAFRVMYSLSWFGSFSPLLPQCTGPSVSSLASAWIMEANGSEQLQPVSVSPSPVPVPPGMDTLILNGHAAERDEVDPARKKKKKKKKGKSAVSGECLIHSNKSRDSALNHQLWTLRNYKHTQDHLSYVYIRFESGIRRSVKSFSSPGMLWDPKEKLKKHV